MLTLLLPLAAFVVGAPRVLPMAPAPEQAAQPSKPTAAARTAQARLARRLAGADAIAWVTTEGRDVTFAIVEQGVPKRVVVHTTPRGAVTAFVVVPPPGTSPLADLELGAAGEGALSWLAEELASTAAVTRLLVDDDGGVIVATSDARRYLVMSGQGSGGADAAARARWAATWSDDES